MPNNIALTILVVTVLVLCLWIASLQRRLKRANKELKYYHEEYLWESGCTEGFGNYQLCSLDGGKHWFDCERKDGKVIIHGPANPDLLKRIAAWAALSRRADSGRLDPSQPDDADLLRAVGFTVEHRQSQS